MLYLFVFSSLMLGRSQPSCWTRPLDTLCPVRHRDLGLPLYTLSIQAPASSIVVWLTIILCPILRLVSSLILLLLLPFDLSLLVRIQSLFFGHTVESARSSMTPNLRNVQLHTVLRREWAEWVFPLLVGLLGHGHVLHQPVQLGFFVGFGLGFALLGQFVQLGFIVAVNMSAPRPCLCLFLGRAEYPLDVRLVLLAGFLDGVKERLHPLARHGANADRLASVSIPLSAMCAQRRTDGLTRRLL